ncbi:MAG: hypothetical protein P1P84_08740 [Deferrisomatales bacterium]|nr:hypothetical protein [Deferrisomatales bacterium]
MKGATMPAMLLDAFAEEIEARDLYAGTHDSALQDPGEKISWERSNEQGGSRM